MTLNFYAETADETQSDVEDFQKDDKMKPRIVSMCRF
jgi:hypothetical protein